jgi:hypothetical protein
MGGRNSMLMLESIMDKSRLDKGGTIFKITALCRENVVLAILEF